MLLIIAIVGTTVAPWQLFFQQSNVIDKRITPRWINYERADTAIGSVVVILGAAALLIAAASAFSGTPLHGQFGDAGAVATGLGHRLGSAAGSLFAIALLNASIIGAAAVTLSSSYAFGDVFGRRHSLHHGPSHAKAFYGSYAAMVALAAGIVLIPGAPLGTITTAVQALAGVLLPSATVFLVLLCNDKAVLGPWTNPGWLNATAAAIVGVLVVLSAILTATTLFPQIDVKLLAESPVRKPARAGSPPPASTPARAAGHAAATPRATSPVRTGRCRSSSCSNGLSGHAPAPSGCTPCAATLRSRS